MRCVLRNFDSAIFAVKTAEDRRRGEVSLSGKGVLPRRRAETTVYWPSAAGLRFITAGELDAL